jgi:hypothetical protein
VECDVLRPVQHVDNLETAYNHMNVLRLQWPGDYLILEGDAAGASIFGRDGNRNNPAGQ